ncbi:MAG: glutamate--tRNA ligase [Gammaproteobacteria bacterium]|nr:MAG: glutamate--tRNA ligase [Gammaproteobacteria bacterium]
MMTITRFPPSPTGDLHIGGVRTALYNWLMARKDSSGKFILRIEDTDSEREKSDAVAGIIEGLEWLGLTWDEGPIFQSDRFERYAEVVQQLLDEDKAYACYCSRERLDKLRETQMANKEKPKYDGHCRNNPQAKIDGEASAIKPVIRFKNPLHGEVVWQDLVHGEIRFANAELDDLIIQRPNGTPTYNFCVVVDDIDMGMTHVVRGDDHINNTPRQINIFTALGKTVPLFGHVGMILGDDGRKLSKRHGASSVLAFRDAGYLPEAVLNYLVRLGWSHGDQEVFSIEEMIALFDITDVNKSASAFNTEKLNWLNQHYMKTLPVEAVVPALAYQYQRLGITTGDYPLAEIIPYYAERAKTLVDMAKQTRWLFQTPSEYPPKAMKKAFHADAVTYLQAIADKINTLSDWQQSALHGIVADVVNEHAVGFGKVGMPLRLALTGGQPSPNIDEIMLLLGKEKTLAAITTAVRFIQAPSEQ